MFDLDKWTEILKVLGKNKMRTFLTALGVGWGILMLVLMASAGIGLENGVKQNVKNFETNSCFLWTSRTSKPYKGYLRGRYWSFENSDIKLLEERVEGIDLIAPRLGGWRLRSGNNTVRGKRTGSFNIMGDYPAYNIIDQHELLEGRFINDIDIKEKRKVCVIGERVREMLFEKGEEAAGQYVKILGIYYQVVGVHKPQNNVNFGGRKTETIYLPFTTMQQAYNYGDQIHMFAITAKKGYSVSRVEQQVLKLVKASHDIAPDDMQAVAHLNIERQALQMEMLFLGIRFLVWIVGIGTLLAGVIGVSNIMLVIVKERTQEIGVMRAIGATPRAILGQIVMESVVLTTISGWLGLFIGVVITELANKGFELMREQGKNLFFRDLGIDLNIAIYSLIILVIAGILAGLIPANRAIRIKPIDALRAE